MLKTIFTWWNGGAFGTRFHIGRRGIKVGEDAFGNTYYEARDNSDSYGDHKRRWVIYTGYSDASKVPPEWHGWLHYTFDDVADPSQPSEPLVRKGAPAKSHRHAQCLAAEGLDRSHRRAPHATGDYQPWTPE